MRRAIALGILIFAFISSNAFAAPPKATVKVVLSQTPLSPGGKVVAAIVIDFPKGLHAQSHQPLDPSLIPLVAKIAENADFTAADPMYPAGKIETYPLLGKLSVYEDEAIVYVPLTVSTSAADGKSIKFAGSVRYQMCTDKECFAPVNSPFELDVPVATQGSFITATKDPYFTNFDFGLLNAPATKPAATTSPAATQPAAVASDGGASDGPQSLVGAIALALVVGLIFNVVPCVLPVLPLKAIGFYEASGKSRARSMLLGAAFMVGMVAVFAALAIVILLSKSLFHRQIQWGELFARGWFVWSVAGLTMVLGLWTMGAINFSVLPNGVYGLSFRHDTIGGNLLWGALTALLSTPCTAPYFPGLVAWALVQPLAQGFIVIVCVGVGMALPYVVLSAFPEVARRFPRTGPFSEIFKQMLGFLLIGTSAFFVGVRLLRDPNQWWLVFAVAVIAAAFLIIRTRQIFPSTRAMTIASVLSLLIAGSAFAGTLHLTAAPPIQWKDFSPAAVADAQHGGQTVLIEFTASWCLNCKYIEQTVYHDPAVQAELAKRNIVTLKADLTDYSAIGWPLLNELGGTGIPFTAIYPPGGKPLTLESIYTVQTLLTTLDQAHAQETARR